MYSASASAVAAPVEYVPVRLQYDGESDGGDIDGNDSPHDVNGVSYELPGVCRPASSGNSDQNKCEEASDSEYDDDEKTKRTKSRRKLRKTRIRSTKRFAKSQSSKIHPENQEDEELAWNPVKSTYKDSNLPAATHCIFSHLPASTRSYRLGGTF